jgi:GH25 family lysozyme M1 (1,4-beta-N-acetylmuramidase)
LQSSFATQIKGRGTFVAFAARMQASANKWIQGAVVAACVVGAASCAKPGAVDKVGTNSFGLEVCASTVVEGVDVSYYDGDVNWSEVQASGRQFAIARVSDGTGFLDPQFSSNWSGIKAVGMVRGVYQFFRPEDDAVAQADIVVSGVGSIGVGDLPPVLDVEVTDGESSATIVAGMQAWVSEIRAKLGVTPIIYTAPGFWDGISGAGGLDDTTLWVANWEVSCPSMPYTWSSWSFWQYSDTGSVSGISDAVDLDRFNGTSSQLLAFAGGASSGGGGDGGAPDEGAGDGAVGDGGGGDGGGGDDGGAMEDGGGGDDGGATDGGGADGGGGSPSPPDACSEGPGFCTATLQCDDGQWTVRQDDPSTCTTVSDVEEPCDVGDGYCTETLQCEGGNWVPRDDDPDACTSGPGA